MTKLLQTLVDFLTKADQTVLGDSSDNIETWFLNELQNLGHGLLGDAQAVGSTVLQMLIGVAKGKLAAA